MAAVLSGGLRGEEAPELGIGVVAELAGEDHRAALQAQELEMRGHLHDLVRRQQVAARELMGGRGGIAGAVVIVLLDSIGKYTRLGDAERVKHWLETGDAMPEAIKRAVAKTRAQAAKVRGPVRGSFAPRASAMRRSCAPANG